MGGSLGLALRAGGPSRCAASTPTPRRCASRGPSGRSPTPPPRSRRRPTAPPPSCWPRPSRQIAALARRALAAGGADCLVTDLGSAKGAVVAGLTAGGARALHRRPPGLRGRAHRGGVRARVAVPRRHLVPDAGGGGAAGPVRAPPRPRRVGRRPTGGDRPRRARPPDGARVAPAARAGRRAGEPGGGDRTRWPRGPALGRAVVRGPDPGGGVEPAAVGRHPDRQPGGGARRAARLPRPPGRGGGCDRARATATGCCASSSTRRRPAPACGPRPTTAPRSRCAWWWRCRTGRA